MKQNKIVDAYKTIKNMNGEKFHLPVAYKLYKLRKELEPHFDFKTEQEKAAIAEFEGKVNDNGSVSFKSPEIAQQFVDKLKELGDMEIETEIEPVVIRMEDVHVELTPNEIEKLDGFIDFE